MNRYLVISVIYICITVLTISIFAISKDYRTLWFVVLFFLVDRGK